MVRGIVVILGRLGWRGTAAFTRERKVGVIVVFGGDGARRDACSELGELHPGRNIRAAGPARGSWGKLVRVMLASTAAW